MGLREVSAVLWRERHLLELLLFKLDEEQLVLAAGRTRWLARATREVEMVLEELRQTELERAVEVARLADDFGLPEGASLRQLADAAPEPWQGMLTEHRQAFLTLTDEISSLTHTNRELLLRGQKAVQDVLATIGDGRIEVGAGVGYGGRPASPEHSRPLVTVNATGEEVFGPAGNDAFAVLTAISDDLRNNPGNLTSSRLGELDAGHVRLQNALASVGSRYHQIEIMQARNQANQLESQNQLSEVEGVDLPAAAVDLQLQKVAYQAALGATARSLQPTLMDFLR